MTAESNSLVDALDPADRAALLNGADDWRTVAYPAVGLPSVEVSDGPHGLRTETGVDMVWIPATCFPTASALGATWDRDLVERVGVALGEECRAMGVQLLLGPGVNMKRTPLCGRNFEYFGEDPVLAGDLAAAYIRGLQGTGVGACLKHYAANNQETERREISVEADERTLRELYLEAFRRVIVEADPWAVMCSYNRIGGVHASQHRWLLTDVLRDEWGYAGLVISDWDAVHDPAAAVAAGMDLQMPGTGGRTTAAIVEAVAQGRLDQADVDRAAGRVAAFVGRAAGVPAAPGPLRDLGIVPGAPLTVDQLALLQAGPHHALAAQAAQAAATLLRNVDGALPLSADGTQRLAVIGAYAATPRIQGGGSAGVAPTRVDEPLVAIRALAGDRVDFAPGYAIPDTDQYQDLAPAAGDADRLREEAVAVAAAADVIVAFVGVPLAWEVEAADRPTLSLPDEQLELLAALAALGKPLIVVLAAGSAVTMTPWHDSADAILLSWLGGQAVGSAVAAVLFGAEPGGRLGETFPLALSDTPGIDTFPGADGVVRYDEGSLIGYRWYDRHGLDVAYPFGHGLSYTTFAHEDVAVAADGDAVVVTARVTNTGARPGSDVVQVYVERAEADPHRPLRELRAFAKVHLLPGESGAVRFRLGVRDFAWANPQRSSWRQDPGRYAVVLASSARDEWARLTVERPAGELPFRAVRAS